MHPEANPIENHCFKTPEVIINAGMVMDNIFTYNTLLQYSALLNVHMGGRVR